MDQQSKLNEYSQEEMYEVWGITSSSFDQFIVFLFGEGLLLHSKAKQFIDGQREQTKKTT